MKILLTAFYSPGIRAIEFLIQAGLQPDQIKLLTHDIDRNRALLAYAKAQGIETRISSIKSSSTRKWIERFHPDIMFSLYFRDIVPQAILDIPLFGAVNLHPALLPQYRGTFSVPWAIINGERYTGFTYHYMLSQVDAGHIIIQRRVPIKADDTAYSLYHRLIIEGMTSFGEVIRLVFEERYAGKPQEGESTYYSRKIPFGGYIDPRWSREKIDHFIRAMYFPPFEGALIRLSDGEDKEIARLEEYDALVKSKRIELWPGVFEEN